MLELHIPDGINYECTGCGKCCGGWSVPMTQDDYERISVVDWSALRPEYKGKDLFRPLKNYESNGTPYTHRIAETGTACPFLVDNLCFIHTKNGSEFKPTICQLFPYCFSETPSGVYATVSFVSAGAVYNSGKPLLEQREYLESKWKDFQSLYPDYRPDWSQIKLAVEQPISWDQYLQHDQVLLKHLGDTSISIEQRLLNASQYLMVQVQQAKNGGVAPSVPPQMPTMESAGLLKTLDKSLLVVFHNMYFPAKQLRQGEADFNVLRLINQHLFGSKRLAMPGQSFDIEELTEMKWPAGDPEIDNVLYRYVFSHVFGKKYFGAGFGQVSVTAGFHHLIMLFGLIKLHARATAKMRGAPVVSLMDVVASVRQAERQVGETRLGGYSAAAWEMMLFPPQRARRFLLNC